MNWRLYEGDCLRVMRELDDNCIDAVITDPPYSSGGITASQRTADPVSKYVQSGTKRQDISFIGDQRDQRSWHFWLIMVLSECSRLLKQGGRLYMFSDWRQLPTATDAVQAAGLVWRGVIPWDKGRGSRSPHTGYHRHQCEYIVFATKGPCMKANGRGPFDGCLRGTVPGRKLHPTQKPVEIMRELVRCIPPGGTILDPFAGSGTTMEATMIEGYNVIGIEQVSEYCNIIRERLSKVQNYLITG